MAVVDRETDDSSQVGQPTMSPDDMYLVFVSDMPGGQGGRDLWYMKFNESSEEWGSAEEHGSRHQLVLRRVLPAHPQKRRPVFRF